MDEVAAEQHFIVGNAKCDFVERDSFSNSSKGNGRAIQLHERTSVAPAQMMTFLLANLKPTTAGNLIGLKIAPLTMAKDRPQVGTVNTYVTIVTIVGPVTPIRNYSPSLESVATRVNARVGYSRSNRNTGNGNWASTLWQLK